MTTGGKRWRRYEISAIASAYCDRRIESNSHARRAPNGAVGPSSGCARPPPHRSPFANFSPSHAPILPAPTAREPRMVWHFWIETAFTGLHIRGRTYCPGATTALISPGNADWNGWRSTVLSSSWNAGFSLIYPASYCAGLPTFWVRLGSFSFLEAAGARTLRSRRFCAWVQQRSSS
jgi:hypothetical protein